MAQKTVMINRIKQLPKGMKWRISVMLVWLTLFIMGFNDFYVRQSAVDGLCFIGVFLFCILFPDRRRGRLDMSDSYCRLDYERSFMNKYPYRPTGNNHGGELPPSADDCRSTSISYTPSYGFFYSHDSSSASIRWENSHDRYQSNSSISSSSYDTSHLFRNNF